MISKKSKKNSALIKPTLTRGSPNLDQYPSYLQELLKWPPHEWDNPKVKISFALKHSESLLPTLINNNPHFSDKLIDFLTGKKRILIVGGESGMGKSLLVASLRLFQKDLSLLFPNEFPAPLVVISWDRAHQAFYEEASVEAGTTLPLPPGETPVEARSKISQVLTDLVVYALKYLNPHFRIIVEAPLFDQRGENIFVDLEKYRPITQTFIMHSPQMRLATLKEGRLMATSGQPEFMAIAREKILQKLFGSSHHLLSQEAQEELIKNWWEREIRSFDGQVLHWDLESNKLGVDIAVNAFKEQLIKPDILYPKSISRFSRRLYESVFETIPNLDQFLAKITP